MKVKTIQQIAGTEREVHGEGFTSYRMILAKDSMGFSVHKTVIPKGDPQHWHYKNHLESCYCISGKGVLTNLSTAEKFNIVPDTIYILDNHDDHTFQAIEDVVLISVFNPPITGNEIHNSDGSYSVNQESLAERIVTAISLTKNDFDAIEETKKLLNHG